MTSEVLVLPRQLPNRTEPEAARAHDGKTRSSKGPAPESAFHRHFLKAALHNKGLFLNRSDDASRRVLDSDWKILLSVTIVRLLQMDEAILRAQFL